MSEVQEIEINEEKIRTLAQRVVALIEADGIVFSAELTVALCSVVGTILGRAAPDDVHRNAGVNQAQRTIRDVADAAFDQKRRGG